jgi:hypothetical protein
MKPVHIDGSLIFIIGVCGSIQLSLSADSVYQYLPPKAVFLTKVISGAVGAGATALVGFRSKVYANSQAQIPPLQPPTEPVKANSTESKTS